MFLLKSSLIGGLSISISCQWKNKDFFTSFFSLKTKFPFSTNNKLNASFSTYNKLYSHISNHKTLIVNFTILNKLNSHISNHEGVNVSFSMNKKPKLPQKDFFLHQPAYKVARWLQLNLFTEPVTFSKKNKDGGATDDFALTRHGLHGMRPKMASVAGNHHHCIVLPLSLPSRQLSRLPQLRPLASRWLPNPKETGSTFPTRTTITTTTEPTRLHFYIQIDCQSGSLAWLLLTFPRSSMSSPTGWWMALPPSMSAAVPSFLNANKKINYWAYKFAYLYSSLSVPGSL